MKSRNIKTVWIISLIVALFLMVFPARENAGASDGQSGDRYRITASSDGSGSGFQWIILDSKTGEWYRYEKPSIGTSQVYFHSGSADGKQLSSGELWEYRFYRTSR